MKLAVVGSRTFLDRLTVFFYLQEYYKVFGDNLELVSGGCPRGPDYFAEEFASLSNIPIKIFPANWNEHGKAAGFIRNSDIANYADEVIAFWDRKSKGTLDTIKKAEKQNKQVIIIDDTLTVTEKCFKMLASK